MISIRPAIHKVRAVLLQQGNMLVVRSRTSKGNLVLPGGHVEEGETSAQALVRELKEELGIMVAEHGFSLLKTFSLKAPRGKGKIVVDAYVVTTWEGAITLKAEIQELRWITPVEIQALNLSSGIRSHIVPALQKKGLFF